MSDETSALTVPAPPQSEADYAAIHDAVMQTGRGRWFLAEYARRNRSADTALLLTAIDRIEAALLGRAAALPNPDLSGLRESIAQAKGAFLAAGDEPHHIFATTAQALDAAVHGIRTAVEHVQDTAWAMREDDPRGAEFESQARLIEAACADIERIRDRVHAMASLLADIEAQIGAASDEAPAGDADAAPDVQPPPEQAQSAAVEAPVPVMAEEPSSFEAEEPAPVVDDVDLQDDTPDPVIYAAEIEAETDAEVLFEPAPRAASNPRDLIAALQADQDAAPMQTAAPPRAVRAATTPAVAVAAPPPAETPAPKRSQPAVHSWLDTLAPPISITEMLPPRDDGGPDADDDDDLNDDDLAATLFDEPVKSVSPHAVPEAQAPSSVAVMHAAEVTEIRPMLMAPVARVEQPAEATARPAALARVSSAAPLAAKPDPLAPVMALSDEEKIALFT